MITAKIVAVRAEPIVPTPVKTPIILNAVATLETLSNVLAKVKEAPLLRPRFAAINGAFEKVKAITETTSKENDKIVQNLRFTVVFLFNFSFIIFTIKY